MAFTLRLFGALRPGLDWHIECHQFRIEARQDAAGQPTPEGVHRDGVDCVLVLMVSSREHRERDHDRSRRSTTRPLEASRSPSRSTRRWSTTRA